MLEKRSMLVLGGVALAAFLTFLVLGPQGESPFTGEGRSAADGSALRAGQAARGEKTALEADDPERGAGADAAERLKARTKKKSDGKGKNKPDPELLKKLGVPGDQFTASGPPESPKPGIVHQDFAGTLAVGGGAGAGGPAGGDSGEDVDGGGEEEKDGPEEPPANCPLCEVPGLRSMIVDIVKQPVFDGAFEQTCSSPFITAGFGEQFEIDGEPACVIFFPETCRGSALALFEKRFFVTVIGECIPSRGYLKSVLRR